MVHVTEIFHKRPLLGLRWKKLVSLFATLLFGVLGNIIKFSEVDQLEAYNLHAVQNADLCLQFAQELLSTFSTSLGEVSLIPAVGGVFTVDITHALAQDQEVANGQRPTIQTLRLWDRKAEGGFPGKSSNHSVQFVASKRSMLRSSLLFSNACLSIDRDFLVH